MTAIEAVVARFARAKRHDLWPRFTARAAGVTTPEARDAMVKLAEDGLLDLWYVVMCESGDEVSRTKHPEPAPIGQRVTCYRCDVPRPSDVTTEDVYLMFSPTERLLTLAGQVEDDDASPKGSGARSAASAPSPADPEELARCAPGWDGEKRVVELHVHEHHHYGDTFGGDIVGGDKTGGRKVVGGDNIGGRGTVGDHSTITTAAAPAKKKKTASRVVIAVGIIIAIATAVVCYLLAHDGTLSVAVALPVATLGVGATLTTANMIASHLRG